MIVSSGSAVVKAAKESLVITELIRGQALEFIVMLGCGMIVAILYGFYKRYIGAFVKNVVLNFLSEVIFWIFAAVVTCDFLYFCSLGALKIHIMVAFICGVFLWRNFFCDKMKNG